MSTETERTELSMMTAAIGQAIGYGDVEDAFRIQKLMMDWIHSDDSERRTIYCAFRNEGPLVGGPDAP